MAFVTSLTTDEETVLEPTWGQVEWAIDALDGDNLTLVTLGPAPPLGPPEGDHHMAVGGGKDGSVVVYMTTDNVVFWSLADHDQPDPQRRILMRTGGQEGDFRDAQRVPRSWALEAAREYFEHGARAKDLMWTTEGSATP